MRIGVDLMGNDNCPLKLLEALEQIEGAELVVFATSELKTRSSSIEIVPTKEFIAMDEPPLATLRKKKNSSLAVGLRQLKMGKIDAFVSAGNTGALVSGAKMILGNYSGISRPALLALMPTKKESVAVLDVGANVKVKPKQLVQFAELGTAYCKIHGIAKPVVGLLNIGSEAIKGTSELRETYQELSTMKGIHFAGNIEGKSVFDGEVNVLVTDGFTGNVFLKTAEGIASLILDRFGTILPEEQYQKVSPQIQDLKRNLHHTEYPGALLIGVQGIVIKCHGYSTPQGFVRAVTGAMDLCRKGFSQKLKNELILTE